MIWNFLYFDLQLQDRMGSGRILVGMSGSKCSFTCTNIYKWIDLTKISHTDLRHIRNRSITFSILNNIQKFITVIWEQISYIFVIDFNETELELEFFYIVAFFFY